MEKTKQLEQRLREGWGRLYVDQSGTSLKAVKLLRKAGFRVITFPVDGKLGPELILGRDVYRGFEEIKDFVEKTKDLVSDFSK